MTLREKAVVLLATGFYVGNIPLAPGTFGSLIGLPICYLLSEVNLPLAAALALILIIFSVWIAHTSEKILEKKDPGCIVIDEIAGMVVTLFGLPFNLMTAMLGFIFFRILDILKPFPIWALDRRISGGFGVVADDIVAGIFANVLLRIIIYFFN